MNELPEKNNFKISTGAKILRVITIIEICLGAIVILCALLGGSYSSANTPSFIDLYITNPAVLSILDIVTNQIALIIVTLCLSIIFPFILILNIRTKNNRKKLILILLLLVNVPSYFVYFEIIKEFIKIFS